MIGNQGMTHYVLQFIAQTIITMLFAIFIPITIYKINYFSKFDAKENSVSVLGTFLGVLVAGCPACSISIATYIGLAGIVGLLPHHGLELKVIAIPLMVYSCYSLLKDLHTCKIKKK